MKRYNSIILLLSLMIICETILAQRILTIEETIAIVSASNYDIQLAIKNKLLAKERVNPASFGFKPTVNAIGSLGYRLNNLNLEIASIGANGEVMGRELSGNYKSTSTIQAGVQLDYAIYDGGIRRNLLQVSKKGVEIADVLLEGTKDVQKGTAIISYLQIARLQKSIDISRKNLALSKERWEKAVDKLELGITSGVSALQAKSDFQQDSSKLSTLNVRLNLAKNKLNILMGVEYSNDFVVDEDLTLAPINELMGCRNDLFNKNTQIQLSDLNIEMAEINTTLKKSQNKPKVFVNAAYNFLREENELSQLLVLQSYGPSASITLQYPLFDFGANKNAVQVAKLETRQRELEQKQLKYNTSKEWDNLVLDYQSQLQLIEDQKIYLTTAKDTYDRLFDKYELGIVSDTDLRLAQLRVESIQLAINDLKFGAKIIGVQMKLLAGCL